QGGGERGGGRREADQQKRCPGQPPDHHGSRSTTGAPCPWRTVLTWTATWATSAVAWQDGESPHEACICCASRASRSPRKPRGIAEPPASATRSRRSE